MLATIILYAALGLLFQIEEPWETVAPGGAGYSVEMPVSQQLDGTVPSVGPTGRATQHEVVRQPGGVQYWILWWECDQPIPAAAAARWLDHVRDTASGRFGSPRKIVSEKKIKLGNVDGREFEATGGEGGSKTFAKGRVFVSGSSAYVVMAVSSFPGQPVPPKGDVFLNSFKLTGQAGTATAKAGERKGRTASAAKPKSAGAGVPGWARVTSEEGGYAVSMPVQLVGEENESAGGFQVTTKSCMTRDADFSATAVAGPFEIPEEQKAIALGGARGRIAERLGKNLKVVSEKPTQVGGVEGQESDLTLERDGIGSVAARTRAVAVGKTMYVLLVASRQKGRPLTPDAAKFFDSFALKGSAGAAESVAEASPARAKSAANALKNWGSPVDPKGDVEFLPSGRSLTVKVPGTAHLLADDSGEFSAPRVLAPARGDFVATVRVSGDFRPGQGSTSRDIPPRHAGGLLLWKDAGHYVYLQRRTTVGKGGKANAQVAIGEHATGAKGASHAVPTPDAPVFLRLERKGRRVTGSASRDNRNWEPLQTIDAEWADGPLEVGVVAVNSSTEPNAVTFENFSLRTKP